MPEWRDQDHDPSTASQVNGHIQTIGGIAPASTPEGRR